MKIEWKRTFTSCGRDEVTLLTGPRKGQIIEGNQQHFLVAFSEIPPGELLRVIFFVHGVSTPPWRCLPLQAVGHLLRR